MDMQNLVEKCKLSIKPNITRRERTALTELRSKEDTIITKSDKGGELVVMKELHLRKLCMEHLSDSTTYKQLTKDPTNEIRLMVNKTLKGVLSRSEVPETVISRLTTNPSAARTQQFYALPKTHKEQLKVRPIVSACGGIFDRLGWLLQHLLKPLLKHVSAHLNSTTECIQRMEKVDSDQLAGMIPVSFDVVSLYTNVDTGQAITTALEYIIKYKTNCLGLNTGDIWVLLHTLLDNNVFAYEDVGYFQQIRGLAMGNRVSGTLAILAMDKFERMFVYQELLPLVYVRYVDDVGTVMKINKKLRTHWNT